MNNIIKFVLSNDKRKTEAVQAQQRTLTLPNYKFNNKKKKNGLGSKNEKLFSLIKEGNEDKKNQIIFDNLLKLKYLETKCINIFNESYVNQHF